MRGQHGPCLAPGNYPAARRQARRRKPPPIILWSIGIITCLLFIGAAAMLTVGYLNPFGTVGLAILGVGAVVYFGGIIFLVLSCLWVERKYPGMQPLSFKIYSRKPTRVPHTTFTNPNVSGQVPADTTPTYRIHNEQSVQIPGFGDVEGTTDKIPCTPKDKSQEKNNNDNPPTHGISQGDDKNPKIQSTEGIHNGGISKDDSPDIRLQALTNNDNVTMNEDTRDNLVSAAGKEEKSQSQPEQNKHSAGAAETHGVDQNDNNVSTSPKRERKVRLRTHHIEVPFEDYPSSDSSTTLSDKKDKPQDTQKPNPNDNSQQITSTTENDNLPTTSASKSTSQTMDKLKEASSNVSSLSHARDTYLHQRTKAAAHSTTNKDIKEEPSNVSNTQPTAHARTQISEKHQNNRDSSQMVRDLTSTDAALPSAVRKATEHERYASKPANSVQKDLASKASPANDRKQLDGHKNNAANPDRAKESVQEKSQTSSPLHGGKNISPSNNTHGLEKQNKTTSPKDCKQNSDSQDGSPTLAQRMQSPDRARKIKKGNVVPNSPQINRKPNDSSSPPRHPQKKPDNFSKTQMTQEQSITIQTFSSSGRKEEIQKKKILHSSRSSDLPSSSSPPRHRQRSPNKSPRLPRNGDHASRKTPFHSSSRNEESAHRQSRHSSPSSQSSVPSSPSSSPHRTRQKSPDLSTKMQRHKHMPVTSVVSSSSKKDELHKRHSLPSSHSSDVLPSPTSSPLTARKLLQNKKEQTNQNKSDPQQMTNK